MKKGHVFKHFDLSSLRLICNFERIFEEFNRSRTILAKEAENTYFIRSQEGIERNGSLLPKCSSDREKLMKFEAEVQEFAKNLRSLEQFI